MPHKILYLLAFSFLIPAGSFSQHRKVLLDGVIKNSTNQMQVRDVSEIGELSQPNNSRQFIPDSTGNFSISFELSKPGYFMIGRNFLYLCPNDHLTISIDTKTPKTAEFKGDHHEENDYLKSTPLPAGGSFINSGYSIKPTIKQSIDTVFKLSSDRDRVLESYPHLSPEFKLHEKIHLRADIINSLLKLPFYYCYENHIKKDSIAYYEQECTEGAKPYLDKYNKDFINSNYLTIPVYREIMSYLLDHDTAHTKSSDEIKDFIRADILIKNVQHATNKSALSELSPFLKEIINPVYRSLVSNRLDKSLKFGNGDNALDLQAMDINDQKVNLKNYAGKVIFIDVWATWCGPCLKELPYLENLKEKYKNNPDIVFISLSVDDDKDKWKKKVMSMHAPGIQWIINGLKLNTYAVTTYPTTIIIDKNFKVSALRGPWPSSHETQKILDKLLLK